MSILGDKMQQTAGENSLQVQGNTVNIGMSYADVKDSIPARNAEE